MFRQKELLTEIEIDDYNDQYILCDVSNVAQGFRGKQINGKISKYNQIDNILLLKIAGHTRWCSMGDQCYEHPSIWIGVLEKDVFHLKYKIIYSQQCKKDLKNKINECIGNIK